MKVGSTAVQKVSISVTPFGCERKSDNRQHRNCQLSAVSDCGCVCWPIVDNEIFTLSGRHYDMLLWICGGNTFFNFWKCTVLFATASKYPRDTISVWLSYRHSTTMCVAYVIALAYPTSHPTNAIAPTLVSQASEEISKIKTGSFALDVSVNIKAETRLRSR